MKKFLFPFILLLLPSLAHAYDFTMGGLCYNKNSDGQTVTVTYEKSSLPKYSNLSGNLVIPSSVTYGGITYSVTSIGDYAFSSCSGLTSVSIPNSIKSIGKEAFSDCSGLSSVTIPNSVTDIRDGAFQGCSGLMSLTISNSVTSIGDYAFKGCSGLTSLTIGNSVTYIGRSAFGGCSGLTSLTIPSSVTSIGEWAFYGCSGLISLTIPNSVKSIGGSAFRGCSSLTSLTIPNSVTSIEESTFYGCSGLISLTIPNSVKSIGGSAFRGCSSLTSLTIPNSVKSIGEWAFYDCSGLTSMTIEDGAEILRFFLHSISSCPLKYLYLGRNISNENYQPFRGKTSLTSLTIGNSVTSIGILAFEGCGLTSVNISDLAAWCRISFGMASANPLSFAHHLILNGTEVKELSIPSSVNSINAYAFSGGSFITSVTIPNSVTNIGTCAFEGCSELTSVNISDFAAWYKIHFDGPNANPLSFAHHLILNGTEVKELSIPSSVNSINAYAFSGGSFLTSVTIPNSVTYIGRSAFQDCSGLTSLTIPNSITSIGYSAFNGCSGLISVTIPNSVTIIGAGAFHGCSGLTSLTIPNSVTSIGAAAFSGCSGLSSVTIPNSVTDIGDGAFQGCSGLTSVTIPNSVTCIGSSAFSDCSGLSSVTIPNSVTDIRDGAFQGCSGLTSLTISNSVTSIGDYAFKGCSGLTSLTIPNSVTSIAWGAFSGCNGLTSLTFEDGSETLIIDSKNFSSSPIENLYLGRNLAQTTFKGNTSLKSLTIGNSITSIGASAFSGCSSMKEIRIGDGIKEIQKQAFANCLKLEDVYCYAVRYPETATDAFKDSYIDYVILHVPAEGVVPYSKQEPWSGFRKVIPIEAPAPSNITLSDAGYATYYNEYFDTELPNGIQASVVTSASDRRLTYQVIANGDEGGIVPAGTAVLLQGKERRAATYTLTPKESTTRYTGENLLHGSDDATTTSADGDCWFYKLAYGPRDTEWSDVLGWFWGDTDGKPFNIEGHKAWLAIPKGSSVKSRPLFYSIDGNAIELEGLPLIPSQGEETSEGEWYDLQGRRLNVSADETPALPGVYIHNGKKVFIK